LKAANPAFSPAYPAAVNPVLRPPLRPQGRVWIENDDAFDSVDLANASYALMLRLLAYSYTLRRPVPQKALCVDLAMGLMRASTILAERAARLPAGPSNPGCNAGMSFTALRDAAPLLPGDSASRYFIERLGELAAAAANLAERGDARAVSASRVIADLAKRGARGFGVAADAGARASPSAPPAGASIATHAGNGATAMAPASAGSSAAAQVSATAAGRGASSSPATAGAPGSPPIPTLIGGVEYIEGHDLTLVYEGKKCIHARFCVTGAPKVFLANVKGPWISPDAIEVDRLVEISHACPSGAIRYQRKDGKHDETAPQVNLIAVREAGPYAVRADIRLNGEPAGFRATLCRCGASKNKPFCDGSHHEVEFTASGEPATGKADMLAVRDGPLAIDPQLDGPLQVRGNLEITSGTGRVVSRVTQTRLCRCGHSSNKPFCDNSHVRVGFKSE
jgi:CDGSH-type Zn-finger protein/uncharacterized Fe-S cluster protein YjdI